MTKALQQFFRHESAAGIFLVAMAALAMVLSNSPLNPFYTAFLATPVEIQFGAFEIAKPLLLWINDGLMALFFFMVGLEIKRELIEGHLSQPSQIVLPAVGAVAGILVPAAVYAWFNIDDAIAMKGWAIPSATDIAFALGVFTLLGNRLPASLKLFLLSVAIIDDIGAIIIIALFYSTDLSTTSLAVAGTGLVALFALNRFRVRSQAAYIVLGVIVWAAVLKSGVHATLAGFAVALFIPLRLPNSVDQPMALQLEHQLAPWVSFLILPLFAFGNAGVSLAGISVDDLLSPIPLGIALGLFVGKQIGVFGACWVAIKFRLAKLPEGSGFLQLYAVSTLCGIGFTMSLFIGTLAFETQPMDYQNSVKLGVLTGSLLSALLGALLVWLSARRPLTR